MKVSRFEKKTFRKSKLLNTFNKKCKRIETNGYVEKYA